MLADEQAIRKSCAHRRRGEGQAKRRHMRSQRIIGTDGRRDLLRILRTDARVHILAPVSVRPAVETAFPDGSDVVGDAVRPDFVALVLGRPALPRPGPGWSLGGHSKAVR